MVSAVMTLQVLGTSDVVDILAQSKTQSATEIPIAKTRLPSHGNLLTDLDSDSSLQWFSTPISGNRRGSSEDGIDGGWSYNGRKKAKTRNVED